MLRSTTLLCYSKGAETDFHNSKFDKTHLRPAFVLEHLSSLKGFALANDVDQDVIARVPAPGVSRVAFDEQVLYGDGGRSILCFPIYKLENAIDDVVRLKLWKALDALPNDQQVGKKRFVCLFLKNLFQ